jgi:hypothetical protein
MAEFLRYWLHCLQIGWEHGGGIFEKIEFFAALLSGCLLLHLCHNWEKMRGGLEEFLLKWAFRIFLFAFLFSAVFVAPFELEKEADAKLASVTREDSDLQKRLDDKSPKLNGFINRTFLADEPGTTNLLAFLEVTIGNAGGSPSIAEQFSLQAFLSKGTSNSADPINIPDEYKMNFWREGKLCLLDLRRSELISERTAKAIQPGESPRGWLAFRFSG